MSFDAIKSQKGEMRKSEGDREGKRVREGGRGRMRERGRVRPDFSRGHFLLDSQRQLTLHPFHRSADNLRDLHKMMLMCGDIRVARDESDRSTGESSRDQDREFSSHEYVTGEAEAGETFSAMSFLRSASSALWLLTRSPFSAFSSCSAFFTCSISSLCILRRP
jgi:hypothetical protein